MAGKKIGGLGKGLGALIPETTPTKEREKETQIIKAEQTIDINSVEPNRKQPRKNFNEDSLIELSDNIKQYGILSPIIVKKREGYYEIIAGERRWRAAKMAGLEEVPIIIKDISDREILEISLIENIQREDLNPIEEAQAFKGLIEEYNLKQDEVAERVNKSRTAVANSMRLLKLDERVQQMLIEDLISTGHARALLGIEENEKQYDFAQKILDQKLSVRDVEKEVKKLNSAKQDNKTDYSKEINETLKAILYEQEEKLKRLLGTNVKIKPKNDHKGKIEIEYYTQDELDGLIRMMEAIQ